MEGGLRCFLERIQAQSRTADCADVLGCGMRAYLDHSPTRFDKLAASQFHSPFQSWQENMYYHWKKHGIDQGDFLGTSVDNAVKYAEAAYDFTRQAVPGGGVRIGVGKMGSVNSHVVWKRSTRELAFVELNPDGTLGAIRSYYRPTYDRLPGFIRSQVRTRSA